MRAQAHALELPGRAQAAEDRPRQEGVEALAQARAGRVLGRGDAHVVAAVVLDEEVPVAALRERDLAEPALDARALVAELVRGVDRDAADHRHGQRQADAVEGREPPLDHSQQANDEAGVLDRDEEVGAPAVVAVLLEPLDDAVGRVASRPCRSRGRAAGRCRRRGTARRTRRRRARSPGRGPRPGTAAWGRQGRAARRSAWGRASGSRPVGIPRRTATWGTTGSPNRV